MYIIDVQGFNYGSDMFICKEIAIMNVQSEEYVHRMVNIPYKFDLLNKVVQNHMGWMMRHIHGLMWSNTEDSFLNYEELSDFIKNAVGDDDILVKGVDKKRWLEKLLQNHITDLHEKEECLSLSELKKIFKSYHCSSHAYNNSLNCALENVYYLLYWYKYCKYQQK